jgi:tartrate-resistant acid phosphatase type 5
MGVVGDSVKPSWIAGVGDNFYEDGISCSGDPSPNCRADAYSHRFVDTFENVYSAPSLQVPWFFNSGNHDWHTIANTTSELAYALRSDRQTNRWNYPSYYYKTSNTFSSADGSKVTVDWVFIDTVILCGLSAPHGKNPVPYGKGGQPIPHNDSTPIPPAGDHWSWINATLKSSTADWLIVLGHYPVWSIAEHGSTTCLVESLKPVLQQFKVSMYINGHDHNLQFLDDGTSIAYIDCGAGHESDTSQQHNGTVPEGSSKFFAAPPLGGFCHLELTDANSATINFWAGTDNTSPLLNHTVKWPNPRVSKSKSSRFE